MCKEAAVIGLGYVGLPLAVELNRAGYQVVGFDASHAVISALTVGKSHIQGISDSDILMFGSSGGSWSSNSLDLDRCQIFLICVPTPLAENGYPDLSFVEQASSAIAPRLKSGDLVILESSSHPGTTEEVVLPLLEERSGLLAGRDFFLAYSPERIDPGNPHFGLTNTPKVVGGIDSESTDRAVAVYESMGITTVRAKGTREAELAKILENTYRHVNIALVNELVKFCRPLGIDLWDAIRCASSKPFGFEAFYPGPGVGGHCIPVDPHYLSHHVRRRLGRPFRFVELAQEINDGMPIYVVDRVQEELNELAIPLSTARVLVLGVTYKPDIADTRETPASEVVRELLDRGALVHFSDPYVRDWISNSHVIPNIELSNASGYDAVILLQRHAAFDEALILDSGKLILDTRNVISGPNVKYL